jgi:hypothetical protein
MMEKSAQPGAGGGGGVARPPSFTLSTITYKVVMYAPAERADTLSLFLLYPYMCSVGVTQQFVLVDSCILVHMLEFIKFQ